MAEEKQRCEICWRDCDGTLIDERGSPYCRRCANNILGIPNPLPKWITWLEPIAVIIGLTAIVAILPFWMVFTFIRDAVHK